MAIRNNVRLASLITVLLLMPSVTKMAAQTFLRDGLIDPFFAHFKISSVRYGIIENRTGGEQLVQLPSPVPAAASNQGDLNLFGNFGNNILNSFRGNNIYLHFTAVAATAIIVDQGVDYDVEHYFNQHIDYGSWARPVVFTGEYLPFIAGGSLFAYAKLKNNRQTLGASFAVIQASLIELLYNSTLKAITGRPHPDWRNVADMDSLSRSFRFG
ncbi:MAG: hypothetical protein WBW71_06140, partial [Bacteroidota bacterium]